MSPFRTILVLGVASLAVSRLDAQSHEHSGHRALSQQAPVQAGQGAFAAIKEIVGILEADSSTDWTKVNLEALRAHLITMDRVIMESQVAPRAIPGGVELEVTGTGSVAAAISEMVKNHGAMLDREPGLRSATAAIPGGVRLTVTAEDPSDARQVARIRGLGFAGLMVTGDHHAMHHLALARGEAGAHSH